MPVALFALLLLLTFVVGRIRQLQSWRLSGWLPGLFFFRLALAAALLGRVLMVLGLGKDVYGWIDLVSITALYVALAELFLDLFWVSLAKLSHRGVAPPASSRTFLWSLLR